MITIAPEALQDLAIEAQGRLHPLHPARAAWRRLRGRALELSIPHRGELHRARADGGQRGDPEALAPDPAVRRAPGRGLRGRRLARRRVPGPAPGPRRDRAADRRRRDRLRRLHRVRGRRPSDARGGGEAVHRLGSRARRQGPCLRADRMPTVDPRGGEPVVDGAFFNSPASRAAAIERIYVHERRLRRLRRSGAVERWPATIVLGNPLDRPGRHWGRWSAPAAADSVRSPNAQRRSRPARRR